VLLPDIESYVRRVFATGDQLAAIELLEGARSHDGSAANPRLQRCALFASDGTLKRLRYQVNGIAHDYRDVILEAEYVRQKGKWVQVRDLSLPFASDV
jgi:hypothetical protein